MDTNDQYPVSCSNSAQHPADQDDCETHKDFIDNLLFTTGVQRIETTESDLHNL